MSRMASLLWKFDHFARVFPPYDQHIEDAVEILSQITSPTLFFWGLEPSYPSPKPTRASKPFATADSSPSPVPATGSATTSSTFSSGKPLPSY
jgi:hypothetical protein